MFKEHILFLFLDYTTKVFLPKLCQKIDCCNHPLLLVVVLLLLLVLLLVRHVGGKIDCCNHLHQLP